MTEDEYQKAVVAGWNACRKSIYAVCEDAADRANTDLPFHGGIRHLAKSIARGFGAMDALDDDNVRETIAKQGCKTPAKP